jgi:hypothetical protein
MEFEKLTEKIIKCAMDVHAALGPPSFLRVLRGYIFLFLFSLFFCFPVFAQDKASSFEDFWVCPVFETGLYGATNLAIGGGAALGYGERLAFGLKVVYWNELKEVRSLELNFLARFYFFDRAAPSGLFVQFNGGPAFFVRYESKITIPPEVGTISAGLSLGWRFLFGKHFFVEPAVRGGYPYLVGAGLSGGVRF